MCKFARFGFGLALLAMTACTDTSPSEDIGENNDVVIYTAKNIMTVDPDHPRAKAVAVKDGVIVGLGSGQELKAKFKDAATDTGFADHTLVPGLIDPHIHMILGAMMYAQPFAPPWDMHSPNGIIKGLPDRDRFLNRIAEIDAETEAGKPLVIYGYHNLVHGDLTRHDLDDISTDRVLIIWHYSGHDFYLNSKAIEFAGVDAGWAEKYHGVPLGVDGQPTGRVYEDAVFGLLQKVGVLLLHPTLIEKGFNGFEDMLSENGVTTVAEMGYGIFGRPMEDGFYTAYYGEDANTKLYLVPEHRAFAHEFGEGRIGAMQDMVAASQDKHLKVLPQVKLFTDAAFYSQTMRLMDPGYTGGQSKGQKGLWVTEPADLADTMRPYWQAGFDIHIHSNGDAAQSSTLDAFSTIHAENPASENRLIIEHGGLIRPEHIEQAKSLGVGVSVASHYVHYMGKDYEEAIGDRVKYMTPLASTNKAGLPTTMHSDAPLAPPSPLTAASVHMLRSTRDGGVSTPSEKLNAEQALRAITLDAAWSLGLDDEIGSIEVGKKADFTVLGQNPMETAAEDWPNIAVWGVVLDGEKKKREQ